MQRDIRGTSRFTDIEDRYRAWCRPGQNVIVDLADLDPSPAGDRVAASGTLYEDLAGMPVTRIVLVDLERGDMERVTSGPNCDRLPKWSPDGETLAFLSDRVKATVFELFLLDPRTRVATRAGGVRGSVEYHHWSSDGRRLLLGVAGPGADVAGPHGGFSPATADDQAPDWLPHVDTGIRPDSWRSVWVVDVAAKTARQVSPPGVNIWEACWCGVDAFGAICSETPGEDAWYVADLRLFDLAGGSRVLFKPEHQLGWLSAPRGGGRLAVVEAICSDRTIVAGELRIVDAQSGAVDAAHAPGIDITSTAWRSARHLLLSGVRGSDSMILHYDLPARSAVQLWKGRDVTLAGPRFPEATGLGQSPGDVIFMREGWFDPPTLVALIGGKERPVRRFGPEAVDTALNGLGTARHLSWKANDGLEIEGWLLAPEGTRPYPTILQIHGGPIAFYRPQYLGRSIVNQALLAAGYAILQVNPRGSSGRGRDYAALVLGDMGGADAGDHLSGLDMLVARGLADAGRIGVMGGSYGGFMTAWLITRDRRFAAAVSVAATTDWVTQHLTSHISHFCNIFLADRIDQPGGQYFSRSPVYFAGSVTTPTLNICGAADRNVPASQSLAFHHALLEHGVRSVLICYPDEGHGIRKMPALLDYGARLVGWFEEHMP